VAARDASEAPGSCASAVCWLGVRMAIKGSGCGGGGGVFGVCMATKGTRGIGTDAPPSVAVHGKPEIVEIIAVGARVAEMANATTSARAMLSARLT